MRSLRSAPELKVRRTLCSLYRGEPSLADNEMISFDFGEAYHQTFYDNSMNGLRYVDYNKVPEAFETYSEEDRNRIKIRMELVQSLN